MAPPNPTNGVASLPLTNALMTKLKPAKIFKAAVEPGPPLPPGSRTSASPRHITGLSFDDRGDQLITAAEDETFRLYNCKTGKQPLDLRKTLHSKKYGVDLPRFTHKNTAIIYASTKEDDTIRYHSLHDNKYLQYFKGHTQRVISLEMSPVDDGFMSGSMDKTVRLWDLRAPQCRGLLGLPAPSLVAYDATGVVFAVAVNHYARILMYDHANFDKAPFLTITLEDPTLARVSFPPRAIYMTSMAFSSSGSIFLWAARVTHTTLSTHLRATYSRSWRVILGLSAGGSTHQLASSHSADVLERRSLGPQIASTSLAVVLTDGSVCGTVQNIPSREGPVDIKVAPMRIQPLAKTDGHPGPTRCVRFNPRLTMMATAGAELAFWIPDQTADADEVAKELLRKAGT
ncbi:WD40-repeat-containing domain protein [Lactarius psammicola]|nr:WD40-repeat-containing domain protein [Lactarius psammicola]